MPGDPGEHRPADRRVPRRRRDSPRGFLREFDADSVYSLQTTPVGGWYVKQPGEPTRMRLPILPYLGVDGAIWADGREG